MEKLSLRNPAATQLPRVYIYCTEEKDTGDPGQVPITKAAKRAREDPGWDYYEMRAKHNPLVEQPDLVSEILLKLAAGAG